MSAYESVSRAIAEHASSDKIVIEKSTVPVRTAERIRKVFEAYAESKSESVHFEVISNPEFLSEVIFDYIMIDYHRGRLSISFLLQWYHSELMKWSSDNLLFFHVISNSVLSAVYPKIRYYR